jgi:hypothetical protein
VVADRLAQPEGEWQRFRRSGMRRYLYPRPINQQEANGHASSNGHGVGGHVQEA